MYLEHCSPLLWLPVSPVGSSFPLLAAKEKHIYWPCPQTDACLVPFPLSLQSKVTCQGLVIAASLVCCLTLPRFRYLSAAPPEVPWPCLPAWHASSLPPVLAAFWSPSRLPPPHFELLSASCSGPCQPFTRSPPPPGGAASYFLGTHPCSAATSSPVPSPLFSDVLMSLALEFQHLQCVHHSFEGGTFMPCRFCI